MEADLGGAGRRARGAPGRRPRRRSSACPARAAASAERERDGRLADPALAGDEDEPLVEQAATAFVAIQSWSRASDRAARPIRGSYPRAGREAGCRAGEGKAATMGLFSRRSARTMGLFSRGARLRRSTTEPSARARLAERRRPPAPERAGRAPSPEHRADAAPRQPAPDGAEPGAGREPEQPSRVAEPEPPDRGRRTRPSAPAPEREPSARSRRRCAAPRCPSPIATRSCGSRASQAIAPAPRARPRRRSRRRRAAGRRAKVITFANQKGGVAKTTTTLNLAVAFAESGHRVLCVDLDPQGNLTMSQGIDPDKVEQVDVRRARRPHPDPRGDPAARDRHRGRLDRPRRRRDRDDHPDRPRALAREGARRGRRRLRLRLHRHAAEPRAADRSTR